MKIIISPAKKMNVDTDTLPCTGLPVFLKRTELLMRQLQGMSYEELKKLWACNDQIAALNVERLREMDLKKNLTPAILTYEGIQYQYMAPAVFSEDALNYVQNHLRIVSGFYGVVKPLEGVTPYRLEMQAKLAVGDSVNLYDFWGRSIYEEVLDGDRTILNLASKEYAKIVEKYLTGEERFVTCIFGEWKDGKVIQKGTQAKMARGEMVRYMAENRIETLEEIRKFGHLDYEFREELSSETEYIFVKKKGSGR